MKIEKKKKTEGPRCVSSPGQWKEKKKEKEKEKNKGPRLKRKKRKEKKQVKNGGPRRVSGWKQVLCGGAVDAATAAANGGVDAANGGGMGIRPVASTK